MKEMVSIPKGYTEITRIEIRALNVTMPVNVLLMKHRVDTVRSEKTPTKHPILRLDESCRRGPPGKDTIEKARIDIDHT